mmetsp:Transcript_23244/g.39480  ORF Transcript_23244/g.39480 Transcript_23244/m.39480 type:complete len:92 (-) Transcript_23244:208-483(-)
MLPVGKSAVQGGSKEELKSVLQKMDGKVEGPYLCGEKVTLADCAVFPFVWRLDQEYGLEGWDCTALTSWLSHCAENEAFFKTIQSAWWWWW